MQSWPAGVWLCNLSCILQGPGARPLMNSFREKVNFPAGQLGPDQRRTAPAAVSPAPRDRAVPAITLDSPGASISSVTPADSASQPPDPLRGTGGRVRGPRRAAIVITSAARALATPGVLARITPNAISGNALGCSFALADGLMSKSPTRGHSTMMNHSSLRHARTQGGRPAGGAHRSPPARFAHTRAIRGILVLALTLGGLGAVVLTWPRHVSAGHSPGRLAEARPWAGPSRRPAPDGHQGQAQALHVLTRIASGRPGWCGLRHSAGPPGIGRQAPLSSRGGGALYPVTGAPGYTVNSISGYPASGPADGRRHDGHRRVTRARVSYTESQCGGRSR